MVRNKINKEKIKITETLYFGINIYSTLSPDNLVVTLSKENGKKIIIISTSIDSKKCNLNYWRKKIKKEAYEQANKGLWFDLDYVKKI